MPNSKARRYGLPQGGALSALLGNLVLDKVDRAALASSSNDGRDLFYARYVDDVVIAHPDRGVCQRALDGFLAMAQRLRLQVHEPREMREYAARDRSGCPRWWSGKSRGPYRWEEKGSTKASVPWVSFLGYQVRYDGLLRVRRSSVAREKKKQVREADMVLKVLATSDAGPAWAARAQRSIRRFVARLEGGASGRDQRRDPQGGHRGGWCDGFRLLRRHRHVEGQLRDLDRNRSRQTGRVLRRLKKLARLAAARLGVLARYSRSSCGAVRGGCGAGMEVVNAVRNPGLGRAA
jgi:hypothetical protein